jgi:hypothetical protein
MDRTLASEPLLPGFTAAPLTTADPIWLVASCGATAAPLTYITNTHPGLAGLLAEFIPW